MNAHMNCTLSTFDALDESVMKRAEAVRKSPRGGSVEAISPRSAGRAESDDRHSC
jgi:hypothetical protein